MVPKKGDLFLQRPPGVDHAVDPVRLPRPVCVGVVQLEVVPPEQSVVDFRKALGVQEIVDKLFVRDLYKLIQLIDGCAKSGSAHQVCCEVSFSLYHGGGCIRGASW